MSRSKTVMWLTDDDLETIGIDPDTVSDEMFDVLVDYIGEYLDGSFSPALHNAIEFHGLKPKHEKLPNPQAEHEKISNLQADMAENKVWPPKE